MDLTLPPFFQCVIRYPNCKAQLIYFTEYRLFTMNANNNDGDGWFPLLECFEGQDPEALEIVNFYCGAKNFDNAVNALLNQLKAAEQKLLWSAKKPKQ